MVLLISSSSVEGAGSSSLASSSCGVCGSASSSYADLLRFISVEERFSGAERFLEEPLMLFLAAVCNCLAAFSSPMASSTFASSAVAISAMLKRNECQQFVRDPIAIHL